ncbi:MAG: DUF177 domain-containing protein [Kordiimonadaceae bacterium]|jgi:uncharacterized metal-binding protein YceD (DUF177 family)|nr:DUF177 domain-containing protein [Kordiimonadaceae bacterium]MBT6033378.1 DUF177 domain-containing protein [Kordiimonadaceae bacterium]
MNIENEFSHNFNLELIKKNGSKESLKASFDECAALAKRFSIVKINSLSAECHLEKLLRKDVGDYRLSVKMKSEIVQQCVISLKDVNESIEEEFSIIYMHEQQADEDSQEKRTINFEVDDLDLEIIDNLNVDIGEYVAEYLSLSMSSYPRHAEVTGNELGAKILQEEDVVSEKESKNPFNVLESLKH